MLSENGRPEIQSIHRVLEVLGLKLTVSAIPTEKLRRAA
jgi:DNA-binding phage protein